MLKSESLLIISGVPHYSWEGKIWAFGPFVREIDVWADLFHHVTIACPFQTKEPNGDCLTFSKGNISITPIEFSKNEKRFNRILSLPRTISGLVSELKKHSCVHVRLPDGMGALGAILAPLYSRKMIAKYAGTWPNFQGEPLSYRIQKSILRSRWFKGPVTVYGEWPQQPKHIIPFFTSILDTDQISVAENASNNRTLHRPARILFVGRLDKGKNAHVLVNAIKELNDSGIETDATIVGNGHEAANLRGQVDSYSLAEKIHFSGAIPFEKVLEFYTWADMLVLVSENAEGWPKAIAEAMAFGLVCFGSSRGLIPQLLGDGRGVVIDPVDSHLLAQNIKDLLESPDEYKEISKRAATWSQEYSIERLKVALSNLLITYWDTVPGLSKE